MALNEKSQELVVINLNYPIFFPSRRPFTLDLPPKKILHKIIDSRNMVICFHQDKENAETKKDQVGIFCSIEDVLLDSKVMSFNLMRLSRIRVPLDSGSKVTEDNIIKNDFKKCVKKYISPSLEKMIKELEKIKNEEHRIKIIKAFLLSDTEDVVPLKMLRNVNDLFERQESEIKNRIIENFETYPVNFSFWVDSLLNFPPPSFILQKYYRRCLEETCVIRRFEIFIENIMPFLIKDLEDFLTARENNPKKIAAINRQPGQTINIEGSKIQGAETNEIKKISEKIKKSTMPPEAREEAERELEKLKFLKSGDSEYGKSKSYLDLITELPWGIFTKDNLNIFHAKKILDEDHAFLDEVKERVLEYIAIKKLNPESKGLILGFVGPPGTGKTSIAKSIAKALGRKMFRTSLGGMKDPSEINGHGRTYVGAMPGRIIDGLRRTKSQNPIFVLDELDKFGESFQGDPASALLEAMDPEQNYEFRDYYLGVGFDLSKIIFITTANLLEPIPPALKDRMEIIEFRRYTDEEKLSIAKKFLVSKSLKECGLENFKIKFSNNALLRIIENYTNEDGVRKLEEKIKIICRKIALQIVRGEIDIGAKEYRIYPKRLPKYLGECQIAKTAMGFRPISKSTQKR